VWRLRRSLSGLERYQGTEMLVGKLRETPTNADFLAKAAVTT
jgi:transcription termination factor Rho